MTHTSQLIIGTFLKLEEVAVICAIPTDNSEEYHNFVVQYLKKESILNNPERYCKAHDVKVTECANKNCSTMHTYRRLLGFHTEAMPLKSIEGLDKSNVEEYITISYIAKEPIKRQQNTSMLLHTPFFREGEFFCLECFNCLECFK